MTDIATELSRIADELRAIAANGLYYSQDHYDHDRYTRIRRLAIRARALAEGGESLPIARILDDDLGLRTPLVSADAAVFDAQGRILLIQRSDSGQWCMPGGAAEVGETPSRCAERETWEETGVTVRAHALWGLYDNRKLCSEAASHMYHLVFAAEVESGQPRKTLESVDYGWFDSEEIATLELYRGHKVKVPEMMAMRRSDSSPVVFH